MGKKEYKTINIEVFRTPQGNPTCRNNIMEECIFLKDYRYGSVNVCEQSGFELLRHKENGHLKPNSEFPLWSNEK